MFFLSLYVSSFDICNNNEVGKKFIILLYDTNTFLKHLIMAWNWESKSPIIFGNMWTALHCNFQSNITIKGKCTQGLLVVCWESSLNRTYRILWWVSFLSLAQKYGRFTLKWEGNSSSMSCILWRKRKHCSPALRYFRSRLEEEAWECLSKFLKTKLPIQVCVLPSLFT